MIKIRNNFFDYVQLFFLFQEKIHLMKAAIAFSLSLSLSLHNSHSNLGYFLKNL